MKITGVIFFNVKKNDAQPDFTGLVNINDEKKDLAIWKKIDKNGNQYYSFQIADPFKKDGEPTVKVPPIENDGLPF